MATNRVVIDVEARFTDGVSGGAKQATKTIDNLGGAAEKAKKKVDNLGKKKVKPVFDADTNKFLKKIREAEAKAKKLGRTKVALVLHAIDKATNVIGKVLNKAQSLAGKVWTGILKLKDVNASETLSKVGGLARGIAGKTWSAMVKIKDMATTPLQKIKNSLFSIKSLVMAVTAGMAAKQFVLNPINIADQYSSAKIGFSTLLGDTRGQQMMDELDAFAKKSPFDTSGVIANAQKMLAMGWDAESIIGDMEVIGNAAASTGNLNQGLESIVRAMSQIKTKGKLSAEELNQLAEAGISAKAMLAEELGYGTGDAGLAKFAADQEKGLIGADKALEALLRGMKRYDGMMDSMATETVEGLMSQIKDTFEVNVMRKWGQGLQDGAKRGFGTILTLIDESQGALSSLGDTVYDLGKTISNWLADRLEGVVSRIQKITNSPSFKHADLGGKIKLIWKGAIANPFSEWWDDTVVPWWDGTAMPWLSEKAKGIGKAIGSGLTGGILAILGLDVKGVVEDGGTIGSSFMEGFLEGFDTGKITDALKQWASENEGLAASLGVILGIKMLSGIGNAWGNIKGLFGGGKGAGGGGGGFGGGMYSTATMDVLASVVNIYGGLGNRTGGGGFAGGGAPGLTGRGQAALPGNTINTPLLTGGTASKPLTGVTLKNGTVAFSGSKLATLLAQFGVSMGSGASTIGGAAAVGGGSILGAIGGLLGIGSGVVDIVKGAKETNAKAKKDKYFSGGSKIGLVGAGAGIGAGIGALFGGVGAGPGALIGAGIGGIISLFTGDAAGKALSDATDEGGWLSNMGESIKEFFTSTLPEKWNSFWDGVGSFFSETIPEAWGNLKEKAGTFFTETIPEKWNSFWDGVGTFFSETVPYAIGYAVGKIQVFFTETVPEFFGNLWDGIATFFGDTVPEWASGIWNDHIQPFFTESVPTFFGNLWDSVSGFFTETLPAWASSVWSNNIVPFFTVSIPNFFGTLWTAVSGFFTETLPAWASSVWTNNIVPFFTETIPGAVSDLWSSVTGFFTESLPDIASTIWGAVKGFFTETIPGWISSAWSSVKSWFSTSIDSFVSGYKDSGAGGGKKARGGIVGGDSAMDAFASGGIVGGSTRFIRVNEEAPEMIIPLSSQRRDRAMKLWAKTGSLLGVPGFANGGNTSGKDEGFRFRAFGTDEPSTGRSVHIEVGGITLEIHITGTDAASIAEAIKAQVADIAEDVAGIMADAFASQFENTPLRGGAA